MTINKKKRKSDSKIKPPRLWHLIVKNVKTMFRDKGQLAWIIGYPLIFIAIFGIAFGGASERTTYEIVVFNNDEGQFSEILIEILEEDLKDTIILNKDYDTYDDAYEDLKYEKFDAIIEIDKDFSTSIAMNESAKVDIVTVTDQITESVLASMIREIINYITMEYNNLTLADVDTKQVVDSVELEAIDYMAPGFIIAGTMVIISQLTSHFIEEKEKKTLERLATTPVARRDMILSAMISQLVVTAFQTVLMLLLSIFAFGVFIHPSTNIVLLFCIPMLFAFTCLGIGLIFAGVLKSEGSTAVVWLIIIPLQFLGGIFSYGVDVPLSEFIPTTYAVHAMRLVMTTGIWSWEAIGFDILMLLGTGIGFTVVGIILFQRKTAIK